MARKIPPEGEPMKFALILFGLLLLVGCDKDIHEARNNTPASDTAAPVLAVIHHS
ncbi:MAG: hypothetical protein IT448_10125 [Phycisphaerales bacterium]|nr:hypothetical protein [Phycisphaerales bacterium]